MVCELGHKSKIKKDREVGRGGVLRYTVAGVIDALTADNSGYSSMD